MLEQRHLLDHYSDFDPEAASCFLQQESTFCESPFPATASKDFLLLREEAVDLPA
jgi:hypothetical protein